jgi:hypothetical protein
MTHKLKIMVTAGGALALAGAGIAAGATTGHGKTNHSTALRGIVHAGYGPGHAGGLSHLGDPGRGGPNDDLAAAATYLGVTTSALVTDLQSGQTLAQVASSVGGKSTAGLVAALVTHETAEINAAVSAGTLTQAEATTRIAGLTARFTAFVAGTFTGRGGPGGPGGHGGPGHGPSDDLAAAATYLGVTSSALGADLQSGKTLAQVTAATSGKTVADLIAALVAHETTEINAAVTAGKVTQAQADARIATLTQRFTDFVNGTAPFGAPHDGHRA